jgi:hypothetical protein
LVSNDPNEPLWRAQFEGAVRDYTIALNHGVGLLQEHVQADGTKLIMVNHSTISTRSHIHCVTAASPQGAANPEPNANQRAAVTPMPAALPVHVARVAFNPSGLGALALSVRYMVSTSVVSRLRFRFSKSVYSECDCFCVCVVFNLDLRYTGPRFSQRAGWHGHRLESVGRFASAVTHPTRT